MPNPTFYENVVIITGASSGIGRELALQLANQSAWLALGARNIEKLETVAAECRDRGGKVLTVQTDVTDEAQCQNLVDQTVTEYGRIDTLINNAGISMRMMFEEMETFTPIETPLKVNYLGSVYCTFFALPHLKKTQGRIIALSSLTGKYGVPTRTGYAASKHAVVGFFDSLRVELAESGVSVTISYPDYVATDARKNALGPDGKPIGETHIQEDKVMTVKTCAALLIKAAAERKREDNQTYRAKLGPWLKLIAPGFIDKMASKAIRHHNK
jgi:short-subunit dehydrogenase